MNYRDVILFVGLAAASFQGCQAEALSIHVRDAPIRSVLEGLARSEHLNLVLDDTVQGTMTLNITNVTASEAIKAIVASQNLWYEDHGAVQTITAGKNERELKHFTRGNYSMLPLRRRSKPYKPLCRKRLSDIMPTQIPWS